MAFVNHLASGVQAPPLGKIATAVPDSLRRNPPGLRWFAARCPEVRPNALFPFGRVLVRAISAIASSSGAGWIYRLCKSSAKTWIDSIRFVCSVGHGYADRNPRSAAAHRVTPNAGSILDPGGNALLLRDTRSIVASRVS
jgi:hypothetical protein